MTPRIQKLATAMWLGFALAAIFFYPLAAALDADPYYLQWQPSHSAEALVAIAIGTVIVAGLIHAALGRQGLTGTVALGAIALLPLLSLGAGVSRQLPIDDVLRQAWESAAVRYVVPLAVTCALIAALVLIPEQMGRALRRLLLVLSPISLVVITAIVRAQGQPGVPIATVQAAVTAAGNCAPVVALLFDELSFAYLYDGTQIREEFPSLRRFSAGATNYLDVRAPGDETMVSVPGYLAGQAFDNVRVEGTRLEWERGSQRAVFDPRAADGLFGTARRAGYSPEVTGYYFPYCDLLGGLVDVCRSFSFYNIATVQRGFSPLHPVMTTLILWPRQFPLGVVKNVPFARLQRVTVEETEAAAASPFRTGPVFRFVHFSIPHLPFVFTPDGYDPPFDPLRQRPDTAYVNQLHYVDQVFGRVMQSYQSTGTYDRMTVAVFADHGFRGGGQETNSRHVPFIVKHPGQTSRADVSDATPGEQLLKQLVGECDSGQSAVGSRQ